ncbi:MAG: bacillithiol biosynthesis cysteine-adding enzyme BshC, partial [Flavobacteriales bacterium]
LRNWISAWPNEEHLLELASRRLFSQDARELLVKTLSQQYVDSGLNDEVPAEIATLLQPNTFTICLGHQLCLLGGPSFIWVKLTQLCRLAHSVNEKQSNIHVVPIFWLASEDHDIAEISSVSLFGKDFIWSSSEQGPTGKLSTTGIHEIIEDIRASCPEVSNSQTLEIIHEAYSCDNLANAWRRLIHRIAGHLGIVVIDGNHPTFKSIFSEIVVRELEHEFMFSSMQNRLEEFKNLGFEIPVNPRECCLFYLRKGYRGRIIRKANGSFATADGLYQWSQTEILNEARVSPENFSPNVLMRPLYQESILPNLLYLAGPSELNYWLQLKPCFEEAKVDFPLLHLRSGLTLLSHSTQKLMLKWDLTLPQLMQHSDVIMNRLIRKNGNFLHEELKMIEETWSGVMEKATDTDVTLKAAAEAELHRIRESIQRIEGKMIKVEKRKNSELSLAIAKLQENLFPGAKYQERVEGMIHFQPVEKRILERLMQQMNPWASEMILVKWENGVL